MATEGKEGNESLAFPSVPLKGKEDVYENWHS